MVIYADRFTRYCKYQNAQLHTCTDQLRYKYIQVLNKKDSMHKQSTVEYANKHANKSQIHTDTHALNMNKLNIQKHKKFYFGKTN